MFDYALRLSLFELTAAPSPAQTIVQQTEQGQQKLSMAFLCFLNELKNTNNETINETNP